MIEQEFYVKRSDGHGEIIRIVMDRMEYNPYMPLEGAMLYVGNKLLEIDSYDRENNIIVCHDPYIDLPRARIVSSERICSLCNQPFAPGVSNTLCISCYTKNVHW